MLESEPLAQQKQDEYIKQLASKVDLLNTHNKILESHITQQANSSTTPPSRLPSKPESNPREQCNVIVLRSGTQLEDPKGTSVEVESQKEYDKGIAHCLVRMNPKSIKRMRDLRSQGPFPQSLTCPLSHSRKGLLRLSLILNLASFLICLKSCMLMFLS